MDRVDIVRDLDQRRLAASRYWQRLQVKTTVCVGILVVVGFRLVSRCSSSSCRSRCASFKRRCGFYPLVGNREHRSHQGAQSTRFGGVGTALAGAAGASHVTFLCTLSAWLDARTYRNRIACRLPATLFIVVPTLSQSTDSTASKSADADNNGTGAKAPYTPLPSWTDVNDLFESDDDFVRGERERYIGEAAEGITSEGGWSSDAVSRQWVASYRLSLFETRRQAQRFFSWGIPDER